MWWIDSAVKFFWLVLFFFLFFTEKNANKIWVQCSRVREFFFAMLAIICLFRVSSAVLKCRRFWLYIAALHIKFNTFGGHGSDTCTVYIAWNTVATLKYVVYRELFDTLCIGYRQFRHSLYRIDCCDTLSVEFSFKHRNNSTSTLNTSKGDLIAVAIKHTAHWWNCWLVMVWWWW